MEMSQEPETLKPDNVLGMRCSLLQPPHSAGSTMLHLLTRVVCRGIQAFVCVVRAAQSAPCVQLPPLVVLTVARKHHHRCAVVVIVTEHIRAQAVQSRADSIVLHSGPKEALRVQVGHVGVENLVALSAALPDLQIVSVSRATSVQVETLGRRGVGVQPPLCIVEPQLGGGTVAIPNLNAGSVRCKNHAVASHSKQSKQIRRSKG